MSTAVKAIPEGYEGITPYLICRNAEAAMDFYMKAFGAVEMFRIGGDGKIGHAEMKIGNAIFMLADEFPDMGAVSPETIGGTPVSLYIYVEDVDEGEEQENEARLPVVAEGESVACNELLPVSHETKPPARSSGPAALTSRD